MLLETVETDTSRCRILYALEFDRKIFNSFSIDSFWILCLLILGTNGISKWGIAIISGPTDANGKGVKS